MRFDADFISICYANVLAGFSPFKFEDSVLLAKHISSSQLFEANAHVVGLREEYKRLFMSEYDMLKDAESRGLWSRDKDAEITRLEKLIKEKQALLPKMPLPSQVKKVESEIKALIDKMGKMLDEKSMLTLNSFEQHILMEKRDYVAVISIYTHTHSRLWPDYDTFLRTEEKTANKTIYAYYNSDELNNSIIRAIARTTDARYRIKHYNPDPFTVPLHFLSLKQWCGFYDRVYEIEDSPSEDIIQDDLKLDNFLTVRKLQQKSANSVNTTEGGFTSYIGSSKEDIEALEGISTEAVKKAAKI